MLKNLLTFVKTFEKMTDKEKIEKIMLDKHLNNTQFSTMVGIAPGTLSHIMSGRTNPTLNILRSIKFVFKDINPSWLFFDDGPMYVTDVDDSASGDTPISSSDETNPAARDELIDVFQADLFAPQVPNTTVPKNHPLSSPSSAFDSGAHHVNNNMNVAPINVTDVVAQTVKQLQRPQRKVVEVRIFFDDGTFESFSSK